MAAKVSIVVPVYNTKAYLEKCLDSLVDQTLSDIEIVIVDDGSTDGSSEIIAQYQEKYPEKILVITKENGGQASARNLGIKKCTGTYIGFADSDDWMEPSMYEEMYAVSGDGAVDLVECHYNYLLVDENGTKPLKTYGHVRKYKNQQDMFVNPLASPWNKMYKREILEQSQADFPEGLIYEDTAFYIKLIPYINTMEFVDKPFVNHILRGNSTMNTSKNKNRKTGDIFAVLQDAIDFYKEKGFWETYQKELEYLCITLLFCSSLERISAVADKEIRRSLIRETLEMVHNQFPQYRKNPYLKGGKKNLYMKTVNKLTIGIYCRLFALLNRKGKR